MKRLAVPCLLALAACVPPPPLPPDRDQARMREELAIVMRLSVQEVSHLRVGQWVLYTVRTEDSHTPLATRVAVVAAHPGGGFWIENRTIEPDHTPVSKLLVDKTGKAVELWIGDLRTSGTPAKIFPGVDATGKPIEPAKPALPDPQMKVEIEREQVDLGMGKVYDCTRLTSRSTYPDGRHTELVTWCSPDVPFTVVYGGKSYGGVVKRRYGRHTLQLSAQGTDAMEELPLPRR